MDAVVDLSLHAVTGPHLHVIDGKSSSAFLISSFVLVGRCGAAPEEIFAHFHILVLLISNFRDCCFRRNTIPYDF